MNAVNGTLIWIHANLFHILFVWKFNFLCYFNDNTNPTGQTNETL